MLTKLSNYEYRLKFNLANSKEILEMSSTKRSTPLKIYFNIRIKNLKEFKRI